MDTTEGSEKGASECAHCLLLLPAASSGQTRRGGADTGYQCSAQPYSFPPGRDSLPVPPFHFPSPCPRLGLLFSGLGSLLLRSLCRSTSFWRPWVDLGGEKKEEVQQNAAEALPGSLGMTEASGKLSQYRHPVRLFWPKSKCYDYLYQEAEVLLKNFPVQATISFYEDSDSEDEIGELTYDLEN
ncbi:PREDICTED: protein ripply2 [Chrysochloris asiatica]|uniref:Protein ripply2 n=1 Tax=Chrysochloris asiatica TaxID=185453 RepID=A0A9B0TVB4_CHRAS|nr:PREDICTED: protein ripply2 [Chrysochloris asiatica]